MQWHVLHSRTCKHNNFVVGLAYYQGKDIVFRFIIEYSSLRDFGPLKVIIIGLFFI
jgi:hypothetical protein